MTLSIYLKPADFVMPIFASEGPVLGISGGIQAGETRTVVFWKCSDKAEVRGHGIAVWIGLSPLLNPLGLREKITPAFSLPVSWMGEKKKRNELCSSVPFSQRACEVVGNPSINALPVS